MYRLFLLTLFYLTNIIIINFNGRDKMMKLFELYDKFTKCANSKRENKKTLEKIFKQIFNVLMTKEGFELFVKYDFIFENVYIITKQVLPSSVPLANYKDIIDGMKLEMIRNLAKDEEETDIEFLLRKFHTLEVSMVFPQNKVNLLFDIFKKSFELIPMQKVDFSESRNDYHRMAIVLSNFSAHTFPNTRREIENVLDVYFGYEEEYAKESFDAGVIDSYMEEIISSFKIISGLSIKDANSKFSEFQRHLDLICDSVKKIINLRSDPFVGEKYYLESNGSYELALLLLQSLYNKLKAKRKLFGFSFETLEHLISVLKYNSMFNLVYFENSDDNQIETIINSINDPVLSLSDIVAKIWPGIMKKLKYLETLSEEQFKNEERLFWRLNAIIEYLEIEFLCLPPKKQRVKDLSKQIYYLKKYINDILEAKTFNPDTKSYNLKIS